MMISLIEIVYNIFEIQALSLSHSPNVFSCISDLLNSFILLKHNWKIDNQKLYNFKFLVRLSYNYLASSLKSSASLLHNQNTWHNKNLANWVNLSIGKSLNWRAKP